MKFRYRVSGVKTENEKITVEVEILKGKDCDQLPGAKKPNEVYKEVRYAFGDEIMKLKWDRNKKMYGNFIIAEDRTKWILEVAEYLPPVDPHRAKQYCMDLSGVLYHLAEDVQVRTLFIKSYNY